MKIFSLARLLSLKYANENMSSDLIDHDSVQRTNLITRIKPIAHAIFKDLHNGEIRHLKTMITDDEATFTDGAIEGGQFVLDLRDKSAKFVNNIDELSSNQIIKFFAELVRMVNNQASIVGIGSWGVSHPYYNVFRIFENYYTSKGSYGNQDEVNQMKKKEYEQLFAKILRTFRSIQEKNSDAFEIFKKMNFISEKPEIIITQKDGRGKNDKASMTADEKTRFMRYLDPEINILDHKKVDATGALESDESLWKRFFGLGKLEEHLAQDFPGVRSDVLMRDIFDSIKNQKGAFKTTLPRSDSAKLMIQEIRGRVERIAEQERKKEFDRVQKLNPSFFESSKPMSHPISSVRTLKELMNDPPAPHDPEASAYYEKIGPAELAKMDSDERKEFIKDKNEYIRLKNLAKHEKEEKKSNTDILNNQIDNYLEKLESEQ